MRVSAWMKSCCHGQRAGRCSVKRRALRVRRPGSDSSLRRSLRATCMVSPGRPSAPVQRSRLCASRRSPSRRRSRRTARREVGERLVFEVADRERDDGMPAVRHPDRLEVVAAPGDGRVALSARQQLPLGVERAHAAHDQAAPAQHGLGDLGHARLGIVVQGPPVVLFDGLDRPTRLQARADRVAPARPVEAGQDLFDQKPKSARNSFPPRASARSTRATASTKRTAPRAVLADHLRRRMWSTSPVSARDAINGWKPRWLV